MEHHARIVMREALSVHYIEGLECGELADLWLREHKGWFPDNQKVYDPPAVDEGVDCQSSNSELAVREALNISQLLLSKESESDPDCSGWFYDKLRAFVELASAPTKAGAASPPAVGAQEALQVQPRRQAEAACQ